MSSDKPRLGDTSSFREVLNLAMALDLFERSRPHPGVDDAKAKRVRGQLVADLNDAMQVALDEHAELSAPPPPAPASDAPPAENGPPAEPTDAPASSSTTDPPPPATEPPAADAPAP